MSGLDALSSLVGQPKASDDLLGYKVRPNLYPGENDYFRKNPNVSGMAAESNDIVINPHSPSTVNRGAVAKNEAFRLKLRNENVTPSFAITDKQREAFAGTAYESDEGALKSTIAARIYSGDPSSMATKEQEEWVSQYLKKPRRK